MLRRVLASRLAGVRHLTAEVLEGLDDRARLVGGELAIEQRRLLRLVVVALAALLVSVIAVVWAAATVVAFAWDTDWRNIALWTLLAAWILGALGLALWARALLQGCRDAFPLTRRVARDDLQRMRELLE
ncbi:MAG: hypothetical protein GX652_14485 [Burkholderiaceae bacterium]|nr:hypothetical protein [Burkholderiaceae bacterium]